MAPRRKSRSVNKRFSNNEASSNKDDGNLNKCRQRKRKLSDLLGSQWSKEELERFYEAYRKHGKDWKKVSGIVRNRSVEMVEALYNMNKAYLSLPEGTASVVGLIAMMTDHFNVLDKNDGDRESNDASRLSEKPKHGRAKFQFNASKEDLLLSPSVASVNDGCLSLLKRRRSDGCTVRKRTPRFPVTYSFRKEDNGKCVLQNKSGRNSEFDDDVECAAILALTEASRRGGLLHVSQPPFKTDHMKPTPFQSWKRMLSQSEMGQTNLSGPEIGKQSFEDSIVTKGAENGDYTRDACALRDVKGVRMVELYQKGKRVHSKKEKVEDIRIDQFDDIREACSGSENDHNLSNVKGEDIEVANPKTEHSSPLSKRKRSKRLFIGDESAALAALQTLADLSLMMPAPTAESGSFLQLEQEKPTLDLDDRPSGHEAMANQRDKAKLLGAREKVQYGFSVVGPSTSEKSEVVMDLAVNVTASSEGEDQSLSANKPWKRKHKSSSLKGLSKEEEKIVINGDRTGQNFSPSKQGESIRPAGNDQKSARNDSAISTAEVLATNHANLQIKRSRRKMVPGRTQLQKEIQSLGNTSKHQSSKYSTPQEQDSFSCCVSSSLIRRWCTFEWFYSAIDYPWFAKREFVEYLKHVGLGHIPRLSRIEWGVIRSSLGKPRRFSEHFLHEEKEKLKQYRESVRKHYTELRAGTRDGLPTDLARPLSVGQRVIALHPKSREVHDGSVLTVDDGKCRIQFDRTELGVEFVMDIDCMPLNTLENMPKALRRQNIGAEKFSLISREPKARQPNTGVRVVFAPNERLENICSPIHTLTSQAKGGTIYAISKAKTAPIDIVNAPQAAYSNLCTVARIHARETDIRAVTRQTHVINKKASSAVLNLRQLNTYPGDSLRPWLKPLPTSSGLKGNTSSTGHHSINYQESASYVHEIFKHSKLKAHTMVDAAIQAMSLTKKGEDAFERIGEALDSFDKRKSRSDCGSALKKCAEQVNRDGVQHLLSSRSVNLQRADVSGTKLHKDSDRIEAEIPSELITSCVATLLMVQMCTERQYPPVDVSQILDSAVATLHPCCPQNLPIYREIQMCLGRIKTQILALVPT